MLFSGSSLSLFLDVCHQAGCCWLSFNCSSSAEAEVTGVLALPAAGLFQDLGAVPASATAGPGRAPPSAELRTGLAASLRPGRVPREGDAKAEIRATGSHCGKGRT